MEIVSKSKIVDAVHAQFIDDETGKPKYTKKVIAEIYDVMPEVIKEFVANGDEVRIMGLGSFKTGYRSSRMGRNPQTGEEMEIEGRNTVKFKASADFKALVR